MKCDVLYCNGYDVIKHRTVCIQYVIKHRTVCIKYVIKHRTVCIHEQKRAQLLVNSLVYAVKLELYHGTL